jgi:membrane-associated protein
MSWEALGPYLHWWREHLFAVLFVASAIDATGFPFPGRFLLLATGSLAAGRTDVTLLILTSTLGTVLGDHLLYGVGALGSTRLISLYCRLTLGSERCIDDARARFERLGAMAVLLGRFSSGVRFFAAFSGSGRIGYWRFLALDVTGALAWTTVWIVLGHLFGATVLERLGMGRVLLLLVPAAIAGVLLFRLVRRRRYGAASAGAWPGLDRHHPAEQRGRAGSSVTE